MCNFAVMYFFPMYFETVMLTTASEAGMALLWSSSVCLLIYSQGPIFFQIVWPCPVGLYLLGMHILKDGSYEFCDLTCNVIDISCQLRDVTNFSIRYSESDHS